MLDGVMTKFPPPLRFTIPALIVASGFSLGAIKLALEVQDLNRRSEQSAAAYLKSSVSQAARMVDYLYRTDDEGDQVLALISQLGTNPGYRSVILFNDKNIVLRASDYSLVGQPLGVTDAAPLAPIFADSRRTLRGTVLLSRDRLHLSAVYPILLKPLPDELKPSRIGVFYVDYSLREVKDSAFREALRRTLAFNVLLVVLGICVWLFFQYALTRRIRKLIDVSHALGEGDLAVRSGLGGSDELAGISVAFDQMAEKMQQNAVRLQRQVQRELILREITERILTFLELKRIFQVAVNEMLPYLAVDRVAIYQFDQELQCHRGSFIAEAVQPDTEPLISVSIEDTCFDDALVSRYLKGGCQVIDDVATADLEPCYRELLVGLKIQSNLVVPLICGSRLWGLLCMHHSKRPRHWTEEDVQVVNHVASQLSIAIQQADLFTKLEDELQEKKLAEERLITVNEELASINDQLARSTRLKDEFLANMSHELRTPLNGILGMAESLQDNIYGEVSTIQRKALEEIDRSGNHLLELINDILDITKIEAGKLEVHLHPASITLLCHSCISTIQRMAEAKSILLSSEIESDLPVVLLDERLLRQVLINLLSNAVKFTPEKGTVRLEVRLVRSPQAASDQATLELCVIDSGIGIDPEDQDKIFQPFVQIESGLNRQFTGSGLGLSIVKRILLAHGGDIGVQSSLGQGTHFRVQLPVTLVAETPTDGPDVAMGQGGSSEPGSQARMGRPMILLAEDSRVNRMIYSRYLTAKGYQVHEAVNGQEAIDFLQDRVPSLLILDMSMPMVDGFAVLRMIRSSERPELAAIPIIVLTALAMKGDREKCLAAGASEYLAKPVKLQQLEQTIRTILETAGQKGWYVGA
ncbi:response regulator [Cyanobium sp. N.Huapi 1H5]|uniref:ATP-binding protein n=1 Tax=Cyanobium sp. N.Huapi 1H5 TaxID=2823719 RepID=UPI0020CC365B|nr:ATP-binding protein [Cyanobium sp. N.Huapi 1H5]MCP9838592.1 response regulator [Cyanobium sp. N.Huapi 1H5]